MAIDQTDFAFERDLAFLLVDAGRKLNDTYDLHMKPLGLTRSQWRVMAYVSRYPGISQSELAENIELSRMAITGLLDRMSNKGLVDRRLVESDRRVRAVFLSEKGQALIKHMNSTAVQVLQQIFANTTNKDREQLRELLETIKTNTSDAKASADPNAVVSQ
jgi:MarR family transcriptional regulator for hemolysin